MEQKVHYFAFNRGLVSRLGLARADVKRLSVSAEIMTNWMPRVLGSMSIRPGLGHNGSTRNDAAAKFIPFVFSNTDKAAIELTGSNMRVWVNNAPIVRPAVTSAVANGTFNTDLASWTDSDEAGAASTWLAGGYMQLLGNGVAYAIRTQQVTVVETGTEHALRIVVNKGPLILRVGSSAGGDEYVKETTIDTGTHSLAFTPTGNFHITFKSNLKRIALVDSCVVESAGDMVIPTAWAEADLKYVRYEQSGDIVFCACDGYAQYQIERRATRSWSFVNYLSNDGPFRVMNTGPITITASVLSGNGTLTASKPLFKSTHLGALIALTSIGQIVSASLAAVDTFTDEILVEGVGAAERTFNIDITGLSTTGSTIKLQRSYGVPGVWVDVSAQSWTADQHITYTDTFDNQTVYYRLYCSVYAAGTIVSTLTHGSGSIRGICRITGYTNSTTVTMEVLSSFGGITATPNWEEGQWSPLRKYPTAVKLYEGRLWWFGRDQLVGSVSDGFWSFDNTIEGDSAPINRTIGRGPVDVINWAIALSRLVVGGQAAEYSCKSTSLDEPLTATNFNIKASSSQGSAPVQAVEVDASGVFIQRGGIRVFGVSMSAETFDYQPEHLSAIVPAIGKPGMIDIAVQRQPDTRIHFVRSDGTAALLIFDKVENVTCWCEVETDGLIEGAFILPGEQGDTEDHVYYVINRTINGATKRYVEKWAFEDDCIGGNITKLADCFVTYSGAAATVITGLSNLEGEKVVVWADGKDVGYDANEELIYTVTGGQITLATAASNVVVGLPYTAQWKSGKLVQLQTQIGSGLKNDKNIRGLGLIMANVHHKGLRFGQDFDYMDDLPSVEEGCPVCVDEIRTDYDEGPMVFPGDWTTDSRLCLEGKAPRPVTILAAITDVEHHG